jgi:hypothetical protein
MMLVMTSAPLTNRQHRPPASSSPPGARRLVLVPAASSGREDELVRRYRMARLRVEPRDVRGPERFAHLKQFHD